MKKSRESTAGAPSRGLYAPFRDLGLVCNETKFATSFRGGVGYVVCSVGSVFHIYSLEKLELIFVGPRFGSKITALAASKDTTFAATGNVIHVVERNIEVAKIELGQEHVHSLAILGDFLLAAGESAIHVFDMSKYELLYSQGFEGKFIVDFLHPETYLNKILVGFADGEIGLFNIKSRKLVHTFTEFSGQRPSALVASPDPDIIAVGFADGSVSFFEFRAGQALFSLKVQGAVSAMSFRTDQLAHFAVGTARGEVYIFDLDSRKLEHIMSPHAKTVSSLWFVPQQPLLVTASGDNSLREFLFESCEYRCLRQRSGHHKPPTVLHFLGEDSSFLLSASHDKSLRFFSTLKDDQNFEFSQGSTQRAAAKLRVAEDEVKLPPITSLGVFETKGLKWDNMVSAHGGQSYAKTWRLDRKTIGQHSLETSDESEISHVSISACGNFALLSTVSGLIDVFNIQSGLKRRSITVCAGSRVLAAFTDATASYIITVSEEGYVKRFTMNNGQYADSVALSVGKPCAAAINCDTELIAVAGLEGDTIQVVDYSAMQVVRVFCGHTGAVTSMAFSSDSKWLISAARDCTVRTWDLPSGNLIDCLDAGSVPVAVALSRNLEFLACALETEIHVSLWSNRSLYAGDCNTIEAAINWSASIPEKVQSEASELCLSSFPDSRWKNIYFLEKIKANTKPVLMASLNKRPALPFFLTQTMEQEKTEILQEAGDEAVVSSKDFGEKLNACMSGGLDAEFLEFLQSMHPSRIDFEFLSLAAEVKADALLFTLRVLTGGTCSGKSFELSQAILALVLRHHERFIAENIGIFRAALEKLQAAIKQKWEPLEDSLQRSICLTAYAREY